MKKNLAFYDGDGGEGHFDFHHSASSHGGWPKRNPHNTASRSNSAGTLAFPTAGKPAASWYPRAKNISRSAPTALGITTLVVDNMPPIGIPTPPWASGIIVT